MKETSSMEVIWLIRDSRGLTATEKTFLFVVASRGTMTCTRETAVADMGGIGDKTFYRLRDSLQQKGLIEVHKGKYNKVSGKRDHTWYAVDVEALQAYKDCHSDNKDCHDDNDDCRVDHNKVTGKVNIKVTTTTENEKTEEIDTNNLDSLRSSSPAIAGALLFSVDVNNTNRLNTIYSSASKLNLNNSSAVLHSSEGTHTNSSVIPSTHKEDCHSDNPVSSRDYVKTAQQEEDERLRAKYNW